MPSPFPGMDPWLEDPEIFPDLHNIFIARLGDSISTDLPAPYYVSTGNRHWVETSYRLIEPDVHVLYPPSRSEKSTPKKRKATDVEQVAVEPVRVHVPVAIEDDETSEWFLEIFAKPRNQQLITAIELLSLSNKKPGQKGRDLYVKKQEEILKSRAHLVEIDLLRGGAHTTAVPRALAEEQAGAFDYHVSIRPFDEPEDFMVYAWRMETRLPKITIPLLPGDPAVVVDLQAILDQCYDVRHYERRVSYRTKKPKPPLTKKQQQWTEKILKQHGI